MKGTHRIYNELDLQLRNKTPKQRSEGEAEGRPLRGLPRQ
jgi:hypothetical protein